MTKKTTFPCFHTSMKSIVSVILFKGSSFLTIAVLSSHLQGLDAFAVHVFTDDVCVSCSSFLMPSIRCVGLKAWCTIVNSGQGHVHVRDLPAWFPGNHRLRSSRDVRFGIRSRALIRFSEQNILQSIILHTE